MGQTPQLWCSLPAKIISSHSLNSFCKKLNMFLYQQPMNICMCVCVCARARACVRVCVCVMILSFVLFVACRKGWIKFRSSCYKFVEYEAKPLFPASRSCRSDRGHLVVINDKHEDNFLKSHLKYHFAASASWLTGGLRLTSTSEFVWYTPGSGGKHLVMTYQDWQSEQDKTEGNALVLTITNATYPPYFVWKAEINGHDVNLPYICEAKANSK